MDLKEAAVVEGSAEAHWYYRAKAHAMCQYLRHQSRIRSVLDVGAGSGFFTRYLLKNTAAEVGTCVDVGYRDDSEEDYHGKKLLFRRTYDSGAVDLVLLMDVLEHVADDAALLRGYVDKMRPDTFFLITVPAFQWLWSAHDVFLEHYRRYDLRQVEALVRGTGLRVEQSSYYFGAVLPLAALLRVSKRVLRRGATAPQSQLQQHGTLTNAALSAACRLELPLLSINRLGGLSVFCLARKL